jgi:hypothetical protein
LACSGFDEESHDQRRKEEEETEEIEANPAVTLVTRDGCGDESEPQQ